MTGRVRPVSVREGRRRPERVADRTRTAFIGELEGCGEFKDERRPRPRRRRRQLRAAGHGESDDLPARLSAASIVLQARLATARGVCSRARASAASSAAFSARTRLSLAILRRVVSRHASAHLATVLALQWQSAHHSATASSPYRDRPPFVESRDGDAALSPRSTDVRVATASLSLALTRFNRSSADSSSSNSPSFNSSRVIVANGSSWRAPGSISATIGVRRSMRSPGDSARRSSAACDDATKGENGIHRGECDGFVSVAANVVDVGTIGARLAEAALVFEAARTVSSPNLSLRAAAAHCSTSRSSANPRAADSGRVVVGAGGPLGNRGSPGSGRSQRARSGRRGRHDPNRSELILRLCDPRLPLRHGAPREERRHRSSPCGGAEFFLGSGSGDA